MDIYELSDSRRKAEYFSIIQLYACLGLQLCNGRTKSSYWDNAKNVILYTTMALSNFVTGVILKTKEEQNVHV